MSEFDETEKLDGRQTAIIRAIAENEAAKSATEHNGLSWFGIMAMTINFVVAVVAAIFGCSCKPIGDKSCLDWVMLAISILAAIISYVFSIYDLSLSKKNKRTLRKEEKTNAAPTLSLVQIQQDTKSIKQRAKESRFHKMFALGFMVAAALFAIIAIII